MTRTATAITPTEPLFAWTGCTPVHGGCPGVGADGVIRSLPLHNLNASRREIRAYFDNSWALTEVLFSGLASVEAFYKRPYHQLRHPMVFCFAHPRTSAQVRIYTHSD